MQKEIIIVTGCSGRIGSAVMRKFHDPKYQIIGFDIVPPKQSFPNVEFMKVDLSSDASVKSAFDAVRKKYGNSITSIIHLAAYYDFTGGEWQKYEDITVKGTQRLIDEALTFETGQFLFSSSILVHAPQDPPKKITESSPLRPSWEYPKSKILTEKLLLEKHGKIPLVILRIAGCYDDECHSIPISQQISRIYEKQMERFFFPGDTSHGASFLHLEDLADLIYLTVQKRKELPQEFTALVAEEETLSYDYLQRTISSYLFGKEIKTIRIPKPFAKMGAWVQCHIPGKTSFIRPWMIDLADDQYDIDISRVKKTLNWQPKHSLRKTLPIMIENLKKDPARWYKMNGLQAPKGV